MGPRVLFISKGTNRSALSPIIRSQLNSLLESNIKVDHFLINGKGLNSYFKSIPSLSRKLRSKKYDIVHIHFSYSAIPYLFLRKKPWIVSFMGSDLKRSKLNLIFSKLISYMANASIVKSNEMKDLLNRPCQIIPNGVDVSKFKPINKIEAKSQLGWDITKKQLLFAANAKRPEKNFKLTTDALALLSRNDVELKTLVNVAHDEMPIYMGGADVVVLSSKYEGSPNVVKEALACNRPVACTDVGDVRENFEDIEGVYIASHTADSLMVCIKSALSHSDSKGREYIINYLSNATISEKLVSLYEHIIDENK
ncbi:MAG: glycosyltransferase family 4 protein [Ekhidna sp.]